MLHQNVLILSYENKELTCRAVFQFFTEIKDLRGPIVESPLRIEFPACYVRKSSGETTMRQTIPAVAFAALFSASIALAQAPANTAAPRAPAAPLQPFTTQDGSASAQIPAGWKVAMQGQTVIDLSGPNGESISLGNTFIARNAAYQPGKVQGVDLTMPYQANLEQKFTMIMQHSAGLAGKALPQITYASATPIQAPALFGQCGLFLGTMSATDAAPTNFEGVLCSLPPDVEGTYKNIFKFGRLPVTLAAKERATIEAILASYSIPMPWLQKKLSPNFVAPPPSAGGGAAGGAASGAIATKQADALNSETLNSMRGAQVSADCFDLNERDTPIWKLPTSCGGTGHN